MTKHKKCNLKLQLILVTTLVLLFFSNNNTTSNQFSIISTLFFTLSGLIILIALNCITKKIREYIISFAKTLTTEKLLMLSAILFFTISSFYLIYLVKEHFFHPAYQPEVVTLLSDETVLGILTLIAVFAGMLAYIFKSIVNTNITDMVQKENKANRYYTRYNAHLVLGLAHYNTYKESGSSISLKYSIKHLHDALDAIQKTITITDTGNLKNRQHFRYLLHLCIAKNNLAWVIYKEYSRTNNQPEEKKPSKIPQKKEESQRLINFVYKHIDTFPNKTRHTDHWENTYQEIKKWTAPVK